MSNEVIAAEPEEPAKKLSQDDDAYLRAQNIVDAINANSKTPLPAVPKDYVFKQRDRGIVTAALHGAFELVGGVPALVAFAMKNPKEFYAMWAKLLPAEQHGVAAGTNIIFNSAVPANPLDDVTIDAAGVVRVAKVYSPPSDLPE